MPQKMGNRPPSAIDPPRFVVSSDVYNRVLATLIVLPISSVKPYTRVRPHEVLIKAGEGGI